jgi:surfeit locus 1 family protein
VSITFRGILAALAVLVVTALCLRLGFWQLDRLEQRRALNAALAAAAELPPLELDAGAFRAIDEDPARHLYRRVRVSGTLLHEEEVVLRGRSHGGRPGVHLVTPLRLEDGGGVVLVNRGWAPSPDAATIDPREHHEPGLRGAEGILQWVPTSGAESVPVPIDVHGRTVHTLRRLDYPTLRARLDQSLLPLYVQLVPSESPPPGQPARVPLPELTNGPHLGYAIQWFSFAGIALFGFGYLVLTQRRRAERPRPRAARSP